MLINIWLGSFYEQAVKSLLRVLRDLVTELRVRGSISTSTSDFLPSKITELLLE